MLREPKKKFEIDFHSFILNTSYHKLNLFVQGTKEILGLNLFIFLLGSIMNKLSFLMVLISCYHCIVSLGVEGVHDFVVTADPDEEVCQDKAL